MATVNHAPAVTGLQLQIQSTLTRIDYALDRGDRRAFQAWSSRFVSLTRRMENLLLQIATSEA